MTNAPTKQGNKYLRGEAASEEDTESSTSKSPSSVTSAPNEILESYLEQRLKAEAAKQQDVEQKQELQQLVQMLRKAYLKQLVQSVKDQEANAEKEKANRKLETASSPFASLITSSLENLLGSRESRSTEQQQQRLKNYNEAEAEETRQNTQNLIRDLLINEVFTSSGSKGVASVEQTQVPADEQSTSDKVTASLDNIDTAEVESITERVLSLTSTEREELVKGLEELGQEQEETALNKPLPGDSSTEYMMASSTEISVKRDAREVLPAEWIPIDSGAFSAEEFTPYGIRVRRQTLAGEAPVVAPNPEEQKQIQSFVDDIRKFFTLLSALDQDQCLQKLVCDVHTNEKDMNTLTQYELNILTTFK